MAFNHQVQSSNLCGPTTTHGVDEAGASFGETCDYPFGMLWIVERFDSSQPLLHLVRIEMTEYKQIQVDIADFNDTVGSYASDGWTIHTATLQLVRDEVDFKVYVKYRWFIILQKV